MLKLKGLILGLLLVSFFSIQVSGNEYYLYDLEKNKILVLGSEENQFVEKMVLEKNPDRLMRGASSNQYLAIFWAGVTQDSRGKIIKYGRGGQLMVFDLGTGRTVDLVEIGYPPYNWAMSENHRHFFITYRPAPSEPLELLHYDLAESKVERLAGFAEQVKKLDVSGDGGRLFAMLRKPEEKSFQLLSFQISPLKLVASLPAGDNPENLYLLGNQRLAVVDPGVGRAPVGSIQLIDAGELKVVEERKFKSSKRRLLWFENEKVLIAAIDENEKSRCYKVDQGGFRYYEIPTNWIDIQYLPDKDSLYILTATNLKVIDFRNSAVRICDTAGANDYPENFRFWRIPNSEKAVIYCSKNGRVKFFDLKSYKIIRSVSCGRIGAKILNSILLNFKATETVVATNPTASRFYLLNRNTNDITVLDQALNRLTYLVPPEPQRLQAMYQLEKPALQTLVVTENTLYKIDNDKLSLTPLFEFKTKMLPAFFLEEKNRILLMTNQALLVLDPATLEVKNCFYLFGDPGQKFGKLKAGEQRYFFIPTL